MSQDPNIEKDLFAEALELPPDQREGFLKGACRSDEQLRQRVEDLLRVHGDASRILKTDAELPTIIENTPIPEAPGTVIDRYKLLQVIGEGGMGVVYMAEQEEPVRRRVALKIIKLGMDTKSVIARFEAERQALAMMDHPNIAKVLDAGATEMGRPYFVMELVRGVKITEYCGEAKLSTRDRLDLFIKACQAIQHAHQKGIIHRDIKPSNILVTINDGVAVPKVIDFGIAKATEGRLTDKTLFTQFEALMGTPAYMSPEQAVMTSLDIDTRSDIYSLGVLLYELLAGSTPFDAKELMASGIDAMRKTIREKEPLRPSTKLSQTLVAADVRRRTSGITEESASSRRRLQEQIHQLQGDLDWIVMKCLEKDRTRRYDTANGLASDIQRHLNNEAVLARPASAAYRFQKLVRRNKLVFTAAAATGVVLVVGVIVSTWLAVEASRARNAEKKQRLAAQTERDKAQTAQKEAERAQEAEKEEKLTLQRHLYVASMNLAQQAWEQNNIVFLRQLLKETQESPSRGFEWYYWQREAHLALKTLQGHLGSVGSVAFSPDGQWIVTGSDDQTAKVWEAASGRVLLTLKEHRTPIVSVAFSPDSQRIVTGGWDATAKVWEAASGKELLTLRGHNAGISSVAFSADGHRIVTGSDDQTAKVWEAASGRELLTLRGHSDRISSVAVSLDGARIVTGSMDQTAKVWEAASGQELLTLKGHSAPILSVAFSPDGLRIVTGSEDQTARVWQTASGRELLRLKEHSAPILSVAFSPDGLRIVTGSDDQMARVWEAASGLELLTFKGHSAAIVSVAFSPDGQRIVTGSSDQTAKLWEAASGREPLTLKGHSAPIVSVSFSPDGQRIVTGSLDETGKVWEAASGRELVALKGHSAGTVFFAFSSDGQRIVDDSGKSWEAATGRELVTLVGHSATIGAVAFSPDGQRILTGSNAWKTLNGQELLTLKGHSASIRDVAVSPDGQRIVTASEYDWTAKVWEAVSGRKLLTLVGHSAPIGPVAFFPDGQRIVTGSEDGTAKVWEAVSGRELLALKGHRLGITSVRFAPDGQRIVTSSEDGTAKVWEAASGRELLTLKGHSAPVWDAALSPDGQRIVTGGADRTARVWQTARVDEVAVWQEEERAAAQYLAELQHEQTAEQQRQRIARARDEGAIKKWLILLPISLAAGQSGAEGLETEQIEGEGRLKPKAGEARSIGGGEMKWREMALEDYVIDFNAILGHEVPQSVAYAVCYIRSEADHRGLRMLVSCDDEAKVYLNGKQACRFSIGHRRFVAGQNTLTDIALNAGLNVLVFKVVNRNGGWQGSIRFIDAQGNPVKGIKVTLDPEEKEKTEAKQP